MSVYQHHYSYGQMPYPSQGYPQPSHVPPLQPYPHYPPQPTYYSDPSSFRRDYASRLAELTFNSRPIIQNLSMIAQDHTRFADIVAQCLEAHIRRVPPWIKLPAFYLLDAMSKNVYDPYAAKFSIFVASLFLDTYYEVDQATRSKMEEMLVTWRTGAPNGKELFGIAPQVKLERTIWGNAESSPAHDNFSRRSPATITKSQVLAELEVTLAQKDRLVHSNPYDAVSKNHVNVLHQLRNLVEAGVSQEELAQILAQLRTLGNEQASSASVHAALSGTPFNPSSISTPYPPSTSQIPYPPPNLLPPQPPHVPQPHHYASYNQPSTFSDPRTYTSQPEEPPASSAALNQQPVTTTTPAPVLSNISDLFNSLLKAGLVSSSSNSTPLGAGTVQGEGFRIEESEAAAEASREYTKDILAVKIKLTTSDVTRQRPRHVPFLYDRLPVQCKQCAFRFPEGVAGKKRMDDHLDMHFRQNRKATQNVGRGHSRSWFIGAESWTRDVDGITGKGFVDTSQSNAKAAAEAANRDATLRASFVVVPAGDEAKNILCPVCKETLQSEFMEEDEEWVWRNAVRVKDKIYHATCHAEMAASSTLAAKLRTEAGLPVSRAVTPETVDSAIGTPPVNHTASSALLKVKVRTSKSPTPDSIVTGTKRKAENDNPESFDEPGGQTPPMKKVAIAL